MWRQLTCLNANLDIDLYVCNKSKLKNPTGTEGPFLNHFLYSVAEGLLHMKTSITTKNIKVSKIQRGASCLSSLDEKFSDNFPLFGSYPITPFHQEKSKTKHKNPFYGWVNELFHFLYSSRRFEISLFIPEAAALHCTGAIVSRAFNLISCHTIHIHHPHTRKWSSYNLFSKRNPDIQIWSRYSPYANVGNCFSEDSLNYQGHSGTSTLPPSQYTTADLHTT